MLLQAALVGSQALLASDVSLEDLSKIASAAAGTVGLVRVVLGLHLAEEERDLSQHGPQVEAAAALLSEAGTTYTIVKFARVLDEPSGAQHSYRVTKGNLALPTAEQESKATNGVTSHDLRKVIYGLQ